MLVRWAKKNKLMWYIRIAYFIVFTLSLFSCTKENKISTGSITYRVYDSLNIPVAGAKVTLTEIAPSSSNGMIKDSGITNTLGYISFHNLIEGYSYTPSASLGCLRTIWVPYLIAFDPYRYVPPNSSTPIQILPQGYFKIYNPLPNTILLKMGSPLNSYIIPSNVKITVYISSNSNEIYWGKYNSTINNFDGTIYDSTIFVSCGDTSNFIVHL